jgi:hypothetical protein
MTRQTSTDVYHQIQTEGLLSKARWLVYSELFTYGPLTGSELDQRLSARGSMAHKRLSELKDIGVVAEVGLKKCSVSGREVLSWDVTAFLPSQREKVSCRSPAKWEQVGIAGVDAGLIWIGDPCYCVTPDAGEHPAKTWSEFVGKLREDVKDENRGAKQWNYSMGHPGLGVSISRFGGDGTYPVFVKRNANGRVLEAKIVFSERGRP